MPGFILDTAAAVGDIVVICSSVITDVVPIGPGHSEKRGEITGQFIISRKFLQGLMLAYFNKAGLTKMSTM